MPSSLWSKAEFPFSLQPLEQSQEVTVTSWGVGSVGEKKSKFPPAAVARTISKTTLYRKA